VSGIPVFRLTGDIQARWAVFVGAAGSWLIAI
jgi:hypothetical protein